jgi:transposase-like protein
MHRDFLLDLSNGFVYDCLYDQARRLDMADHRRWVVERFSGTLCVDELHLGRCTLLLATDPLNDLPVAFAVVDSNDTDHMRRFLRNLKAWGVQPEVVVTDGSPLYPEVVVEVGGNPVSAEIRCEFIILARKDEPIPDYPRKDELTPDYP